MSLKSVFLLVCCLVTVYSFTVQRSDNRKTWSSDESSSYPLTGYDMRSRGNGAYQEGQFERSYTGSQGARSEEDGNSYRNRGGTRRPEGQGGQKSRVQYSSSSSSSSEENSSQSHEIRKVEKQYHNTNGYNSGNNLWDPSQGRARSYGLMNFEASDLQNSIDKDMKM